jgi:hypothetical protein
VGHVSILEPPDQLEFDVTTAEMLEQPSPLPEKNRHQVDLQFVHQPGAEQRLSGARPVDHDRPITRGRPRRTGTFLDIGHEPGTAGWHVPFLDMVGQDEDRYAVVMVTLPTAGELERPAA